MPDYSNMTLDEAIQIIGQEIDRKAAERAEMRAWLTGDAFGGPNGDGFYPLTDPNGTVTLIPSIDRIRFDAMTMPITLRTSSSNFTLTAAMINGKELGVDSGALVLATLDATAPVGTHGIIRQLNAAGRIRFGVQSGKPALRNRQSHDRTAGRDAAVRLVVRTNTAGNNAQWWLDGDTAAA